MHENSVFKKIHSRERFRKALFLVTENAVYVWMLTQNKTDKKDAFSEISGYVWMGPRWNFLAESINQKSLRIKFVSNSEAKLDPIRNKFQFAR